MDEDNKSKSALEELNEQYRKMQESTRSPKRKHTVTRKHQRSIITGTVLVIGLVCCYVFFRQIAGEPGREAAVRKYEAILSDSEKRNWKEYETQTDELFIEVNTKIPVDEATSNATLHLSNPPYSVFDLDVTISLKEENGEKGETLYESERIAPITVLETVKLNKALEPGTYPVTIGYQFYDGKKTVGTHDVAAELVVKDDNKK